MITSWTRLVTWLICISFICGTDAYTEKQCSPKEGKPHDCLKISECTYYQQIKTPVTAEIIKMLEIPMCGYDKMMPKFCCPRKEHKNLYLLPQHECGEYDANKPLSGEKAGLNEFPWMALLSYKIGNRKKFACGGSLINDKYVLTAALCINGDLLGVRIGEHNIHKQKDCVSYNGEEQCAEGVQDFRIEKTIVHEDFKLNSLSNDIALIRLKGTVNARANAKPICLPTTPDMKAINLTNFKVTVTGWGVSEDKTASDVLRKFIVPVVSNTNCKTIDRYPTSKNLCAGDPEKESCIGDAGGPLISLQTVLPNLVYVQFGIVSYGTSKVCGDDSHGIYTRVTEYTDWILDNLEP